MKLRSTALAAAGLALAVLVAGKPAMAQVSAPSEQDIDVAPPQFQGLLKGQRATIDQSQAPSRRRKAGGPTAGLPGMGGGIAANNPSKDPRDFAGNWSGGSGMAPPGSNKAPELRPGHVGHLDIDAARMLLVEPAVNVAGGHIYQTGNELVIVRSDQLRARRIYFTSAHQQNPQPSYNGDSIAHWDGNTLVVDTIAIKGVLAKLDFDLENGTHKLLLANPTLHVVERITKSPDGNSLIDQESWDDPTSGKPAVTTTTTLQFAADATAYDNEYEDGGDLFGPNYGTGFK